MKIKPRTTFRKQPMKDHARQKMPIWSRFRKGWLSPLITLFAILESGLTAANAGNNAVKGSMTAGSLAFLLLLQSKHHHHHY